MEAIVLLVAAGIGGFAGYMVAFYRMIPQKKLLPSKDPMEDRIYPYLFLLETDPDGWTIKDNSFFGWTRVVHESGKSIAVFKKDGDVETDVFGFNKLSDDEKHRLRNAVYKLQSVQALDEVCTPARR